MNFYISNDCKTILTTTIIENASAFKNYNNNNQNTYTVRITYSNKRLIYVVADQEEFSLNNYTEIQISGIKDLCSENETLFNQILNNGNKECNSSSNCFVCINC